MWLKRSQRKDLRNWWNEVYRRQLAAFDVSFNNKPVTKCIGGKHHWHELSYTPDVVVDKCCKCDNTTVVKVDNE